MTCWVRVYLRNCRFLAGRQEGLDAGKASEEYLIAGDQVVPYLVIFNSRDGSSGVKVAMTLIRVVCQNTLNLALNTAKRSWTARHTEKCSAPRAGCP